MSELNNPEWLNLYKTNNYPSVRIFYNILKENNLKATLKQVKEWVQRQNVAQVHKPVSTIKRKLKYITASSPYDTYQIDLLDYQKYARNNGGNHYIMICVDIFTRQAFTEPIKSKRPTDTTEAFSKI